MRGCDEMTATCKPGTLTRYWICQHLDLGLPSLQTMGNRLFFKPTNLWSFCYCGPNGLKRCRGTWRLSGYPNVLFLNLSTNYISEFTVWSHQTPYLQHMHISTWLLNFNRFYKTNKKNNSRVQQAYWIHNEQIKIYFNFITKHNSKKIKC